MWMIIFLDDPQNMCQRAHLWSGWGQGHFGVMVLTSAQSLQSQVEAPRRGRRVVVEPLCPPTTHVKKSHFAHILRPKATEQGRLSGRAGLGARR